MGSVEFFGLAMAALGVIVVASVLSRRTGIAAPLLLLVLGLVSSYVPAIPNPHMEPEWILAGVLPPLLYASSVRLPVTDLRRNLRLVTWLSVVLVIVSALVVGVVVHWAVPDIPFALAVALGAVVSPTDAVAATAIGKRLGLPRRLMNVLEGESLVNDASALVTLRTAVGALAGSFVFGEAALSFAYAVAAAVVVGWAVGHASVALRARLGDPVLVTSVSFAVPWLAYFPAEEIRASGVLAVVVAGLVSGHHGAARLSAGARATDATNWATINFLLENAVFLLMGTQIAELSESARAESSGGLIWGLAGLVLVVLVVARFAGLAAVLWQIRPREDRRVRERLESFGERLREMEDDEAIDADRAERLHRRLDQSRADQAFRENEPITKRGALVLGWAGMRGVVTLAAALTIPVLTEGEPTPYRSTIVLVAFLVAVASLVLFGGTLPWMIARLEFKRRSPGDRRAELTSLMESVTTDVVDQLGPLAEQEVDGEPIDPELADRVAQRFAPIVMANRQQAPPAPPDAREKGLVLQRRYLDAYREALLEERSIGAYRTETLEAAQAMLDREEQRLDAGL